MTQAMNQTTSHLPKITPQNNTHILNEIFFLKSKKSVTGNPFILFSVFGSEISSKTFKQDIKTSKLQVS